MTALTLLPAVDVAGGRVDQVVDGDDDPRRTAAGWVARGATWIHLVDLDQAFGRGDNAALLADLVADLRSGATSGRPVRVQLSGGLTDEATVERASATGADRVVLASSVLADPQLLARLLHRHGDRLVPAVDVRDGQVVSRGTDLRLGPLEAVVKANPALRGAAHVLVADASRDGTRTGADLDLFATAAELLDTPVVASGGIATLEDLRGLRALTAGGVGSAVLGAALYHRAFTLEQALEVCR